jgi:hypothetical protein
MDPFIIIKNYRQQKQPQSEEIQPSRIFLRELDPNTLVSNNVSINQTKSRRIYC